MNECHFCIMYSCIVKEIAFLLLVLYQGNKLKDWCFVLKKNKLKSFDLILLGGFFFKLVEMLFQERMRFFFSC